ncbi:hypothetical protein [Streptomyces lomondensis]|uniref:Uncharacterized protein n=1 Tax=Streptomyces lomondensis TaxID=68229 RepID=A0ABQ2XNN1_9ACTN|nr:hypothetical protein [Streptomyces lomondensis]MCF0076442.1 hypothetical protein [Streptomyces lomondensis]GGX24490.1 hypothetical protein GCM10010383_63590 [Streptomyces lomondensis]
MIQQVAHTEPGTDPAGVALALAVAYALHAPAGRAPEVAPAAARSGRGAAEPTAERAATRTAAGKRAAHRRRAARRRTVRG